MTKRIALGASFALLITALAYALPRQGRHVVGPFTLERNVTDYLPDGRTATLREIYRRSSDGSFRIITTDGTTIFHDRGFVQGKGYFTVDYGRQTLWRHPGEEPRRPERAVSAEAWKRDSRFAGTDQILGLTAYKIRTLDDVGVPQSDVWLAPETGGAPLKAVEYEGGRVKRTAEPYHIDFEEPPREFVQLPKFAEKDGPPPQP